MTGHCALHEDFSSSHVLTIEACGTQAHTAAASQRILNLLQIAQACYWQAPTGCTQTDKGQAKQFMQAAQHKAGSEMSTFAAMSICLKKRCCEPKKCIHSRPLISLYCENMVNSACQNCAALLYMTCKTSCTLLVKRSNSSRLEQ